MKKDIGIIIANWAGVNIGDDAIFSALLNIIRNKVSKNGSIFVLADNDKVIKANYNISDSVRIFDFYRISNLKKIIRFCRKSDLVIYGGGDLINGNIKSMSFLAMAKILGLHVMCCSVGVIPIRYKLKRFLTRIVLNHVDLITVRDQESEQRLQALGVTKPQIIVTSDLAFSLTPNLNKNKLLQKITKKVDHGKIKIGINVRPFDPMYSSYRIWTENNLVKYMPSICDYLIEKYNATVIFIPMLIRKRTKDYHKHLKCDDELSQQIIEKMKNKRSAILINEDCMPQDLMGALSEMQLIIAARLHTLLLASIVSVPVVALEYAPKIKSFMNLIYRSGFSIDIDKLSEQNLKDVIDRAIREKDKDNLMQLKPYIERAEITGEKIIEILEIKKRKKWKLYLVFPIVGVVVLINYINSIAQRFYNQFYVVD